MHRTIYILNNRKVFFERKKNSNNCTNVAVVCQIERTIPIVVTPFSPLGMLVYCACYFFFVKSITVFMFMLKL